MRKVKNKLQEIILNFSLEITLWIFMTYPLILYDKEFIALLKTEIKNNQTSSVYTNFQMYVTMVKQLKYHILSLNFKNTLKCFKFQKNTLTCFKLKKK